MTSLNTVGATAVHKGVLRQSLSSRRTQIGLTIVGILIGIAILGPWFAPHSATSFVGTPFQTPSSDAWFGTDKLGRDVFSRVLGGGRSVILMASISAVLGVVGGTILALCAGYSNRWLDELLMRTSDIVMAFPPIVLALLFLSIFGPAPWIIVLTVALGHMPRTGRVLRAAVLQVSGQDYVKSARAMGLRKWQIRIGELLPNITGPLMVELGLKLTYSIALVASLGFLGLGLQPPAADWGLMINENRLALQTQPASVLVPVVCIGLLTVGFNLVTDGFARTLAGLDREVAE